MGLGSSRAAETVRVATRAFCRFLVEPLGAGRWHAGGRRATAAGDSGSAGGHGHPFPTHHLTLAVTVPRRPRQTQLCSCPSTFPLKQRMLTRRGWCPQPFLNKPNPNPRAPLPARLQRRQTVRQSLKTENEAEKHPEQTEILFLPTAVTRLRAQADLGKAPSPPRLQAPSRFFLCFPRGWNPALETKAGWESRSSQFSFLSPIPRQHPPAVGDSTGVHTVLQAFSAGAGDKLWPSEAELLPAPCHP